MSSIVDKFKNSEKGEVSNINLNVEPAILEMKKDALRKRREIQCFSIVNRGRLWYDCLTDEQITELNNWYHEWLNVTETFSIPKTPDFVNDKLTTEEVVL